MAESKTTKTKSKTTKSSKTSAKKNVASTKSKSKKPITSKSKKTSLNKVPAKSTKNVYAVVEISGSQLLIKEGDAYETNRIEGDKNDKISIDKVLFVSDDGKISIGKPYIKGAKVEAVIESQKKGKKMRVFKYKSKSRYRRSYGHRDHLTRLRVTQISA